MSERSDADERTWALSVFLGLIDLGEMKRIAKKLSVSDNDRLSAVIESMRAAVVIRDLLGGGNV